MLPHRPHPVFHTKILHAHEGAFWNFKRCKCVWFILFEILCVPVIINDNKDAFLGCLMGQSWLVSFASIGLKMDSLKTP